MRTASYDNVNRPRGGLPLWALFAAIPLALALGFLNGIALSTFGAVFPPTPPPSQGPAGPPANQGGSTAPAPAPPGGSPAMPDQTGGGLYDSPDPQRPGSLTATLPQAADEIPYPIRPQAPSGPVNNGDGDSTPAGAPFTPPVRSVVEARAALSSEFGSFQVGGVKVFSVDYQLARDINYNTVLIGIVKIAEYSQWVRAVREHPVELQAWLQAAAERVKPAAQQEKFTLTWTIYEKVTDPPYGFGVSEVTRDPRGGYVVTRPLATVTDVTRSTVSVAAVDPDSHPASNNAPWTAYGPVIRFDPTDLYRPASSNP